MTPGMVVGSGALFGSIRSRHNRVSETNTTVGKRDEFVGATRREKAGTGRGLTQTYIISYKSRVLVRQSSR